MRILHLMSCRGWSSDAYWAARVTRELALRGHEATLGCRRGTEAKVIERAAAEGVERIVTYEFASGVKPGADAADILRLRRALAGADIVHVHRGKEHWLAAAASRLGGRARPIVRTRHIVQPIRPHAGNRWLYRRATALVVTVSEAIRRQCLAADLLPPERVVTLAGGADIETYRPRTADPALRGRLGGEAGRPLFGMIGGLRRMKGHEVAVDAVRRLAERGLRPHLTFVGRGPMESAIRAAVTRAGLDGQVRLTGWMPELAPAMATFDVVLYVPLESEGMSRMVFEYLAAGRPLVASRVGVVPEILTDGEHAALVPAGDAAALAAALERLLGDAELRGRLGDSGRRLVRERYSGARLAAALEAEYARLLAA